MAKKQAARRAKQESVDGEKPASHQSARRTKSSAGSPGAARPRKASGRKKKQPSDLVTSGASHRGFPVVGIGASAGGLEALQHFFDAMPSDKRIAFIVVTHQHAGHVSMLPELLGRHTKMEVCEAVDGARIEPNRVYIAPSNGQLHLLDGTLQVLPAESGFHLPIDSFFRSLAIDRKDCVIGIVLSGTGTDGTLGIKAIKGEAGMVMVQQPDSAKYDGMPRSAIATGVVDFVLPEDKMPQQLIGYATGPYVAQPTATPVAPGLSDVLPKIFVLLRNRTRHDFSHYKPTTVQRRIERRMSVHQIVEAKNYLRYLQENAHELDILFRELLIGVTSFFRDPEAFESLATNFLPKLVQAKPEDSVFRIWSAGCSTGEEPYSLAIIAQEVIERLNPHLQVQVFATDLDESAIDIARHGVYPAGIAADIRAERLERFFTKEDGHFQVRKDLRGQVIFAPQDIIADPPFTKLDLLACRNVLIYMDGDLQKKLLPIFQYAIRPGGLLLLGNSESIGDFRDAFDSVDKKWKIFQCKAGAEFARPLTMRGTLERISAFEPDENSVAEKTSPSSLARDLPQLLEKRMLLSYAPPTVVVSERGEIVYIHGRTGAFLEPAPGEPSNNVLTMARPGLQPALSALMRRATAGGEAVQQRIQIADDAMADIVVRAISEPELIRGLLMITFEEVSAKKSKDSRAPKTSSRKHLAGLEQELQYTKENLQSTIEELQTANEELKSSNEELQSTNEELQSTNEELETSKEELQSLNEELQTVNAELQMKMEDLALVNDDMTNLLNNTNIATVFLDNQLRINRFTSAASTVIKIIATDVGRPIGDLVSNLDYDLVADATEVLKTLMTRETKVQADDGRWYQVRLMPYRTSENVIDGLVATFVDVTAGKQAELQVAKAAAYAQSVVDTIREPLLILDEQLCIVSANESFYRTFEITPADAVGRLVYKLDEGQWDIPELRELLERILPRDSSFEAFRVECNFRSVGKRTLMLNGRRLEQASTLPGRILLAIVDVTDLAR